LISYTRTPIKEIIDPVLERAGVRIVVKREDLNHPIVAGNKWWKLKYNLKEAVESGSQTLLTFGGSYSNHIYAVAGAASILGLRSTGVIRGEEFLPLNPTLSFARSKGMTLHYVSRDAYRHKQEPKFVEQLEKTFGKFYLIPEGGTNELAVKGCLEFGEALVSEIDFNYLCLPVGTGGTMAGIVQALRSDQNAIGFSVLKDGGFLEADIRNLLGSERIPRNWRIETRYHFGGYAKTTPQLLAFMEAQLHDQDLPLDQVYTGKTLFGIYDLIARHEIRRGSTVLMVHTGGLQGNLSE
jgi:1-aminocyclopropane-1-carboxylate deaminase